MCVVVRYPKLLNGQHMRGKFVFKGENLTGVIH